MRAIGFIGGLGLLAFSIAGMRPEDPEVASLSKYQTFELVTKRPVDMAPQIALSCVGPGPADMDPNPHIRAIFRVWVNEKGSKAMKSLGKGAFPVGSVIVKEKFDRPEGWAPYKLAKDATPTLLTAMIKRSPGFDPKNGNWEYLMVRPGKSPETAGLGHCQKCHQTQKKTDFVFGDYGSIRHGSGGFPN